MGNNKSNKKTKSTKNGKGSLLGWPLKILLLSFVLSMCFGILSEVVLKSTGIAFAVVIIIIFVLIAILTDMIGVATTSADTKPFQAMASRKVRGAREALKLISKADRVSSICCDVIGDVCGILSGAAGASIVLKIAIESTSFWSIVVASLISAIVASLTIFGKSICKRFAVYKSTGIVLIFGKFVSIFVPQKSNKKVAKNVNTKTTNSQPQNENIEDSNVVENDLENVEVLEEVETENREEENIKTESVDTKKQN